MNIRFEARPQDIELARLLIEDLTPQPQPAMTRSGGVITIDFDAQPKQSLPELLAEVDALMEATND